MAAVLLGGAAWAAPPSLDVRPGIGGALVSDAWQPVVVTLTNAEGGAAVSGEVQVTIEEPRTEAAVATYARPLALPAGAGTAQATVYVRVPAGNPPELSVSVVSSGGDLVAQSRFEKLAFQPETLTLLAVTASEDELGGLRGARFGVSQTGGALRPAARPATQGQEQAQRRPWHAGEGAEQPLRVERTAEPGLLPDRAAGYDAVGIVYLGDVPPAAFSDAQVDALRGFASRGGLLVAGAGARLRSDERLRALLPVPPPSGSAPAVRRLGRGTAATLPSTLPSSPDAVRLLWAGLLRESLTAPLVGRVLDGDGSWQTARFGQSVLHAPGLRPPSALVVGLFLAGYLVLLVPVNFLTLRRLRRTEWAWWTVPALVAAACLVMYRIGYAVKGGDTLLNVASVVEMGAGDGAATVTASAGLFSPTRRAYDVALTAPGALLEAPRETDLRARRRGRQGGPADPSGGGAGERPPVVDVAPRSGGAEARDAAVPMWAMRTFRARADSVKIGDGVRADLRLERGEVAGTLENRTGRALEDVVVYGPGGRQRFDSLAPGARVEVRFATDPARAGRGSEFVSPLGRMGLTPYGKSDGSPEALRSRLGDAVMRDMAGSLGTILIGQRTDDAVDRRAAGLPPASSVTIAAWNTDPLLPVTVDGKRIERGAHVNLLLVHAPVAPGSGR